MLAFLAGLVAACATPDSGGSAAAPTPSATAGATQLTITITASQTAKPQSWTLTCDPAGGTHPKAAQACAFVNKSSADLLAPVPAGQACTQIYGGPQVATVSGSWRGKQVNARLVRTNGCEISRWDKVKDLVGDAAN